MNLKKLSVLLISILLISQNNFSLLAKDKKAEKKEEKKAAEQKDKKENPVTEDGQLEDVVVTETQRKGLESEKPPLEIELSDYDVVAPSLKTEEFILNKRVGDSQKLTITSPQVLRSKVTSTPWYSSIVKGTVATFRLGSKSIKVKEWQFVITDPSGRPFRKYSGEGAIPRLLKWDGRDDKGRMLIVGNTYSFVFHFSYTAGNKKDIIGDPFEINALLHQETNGLYISIATKALLDINSVVAEITPDGQKLLREASDILKEYYTAPITLKVYSENDEIAMEQAKAMRKNLAENLIIPEDKIRIEGYLDMPENFHVDIVIKNR